MHANFQVNYKPITVNSSHTKKKEHTYKSNTEQHILYWIIFESCIITYALYDGMWSFFGMQPA